MEVIWTTGASQELQSLFEDLDQGSPELATHVITEISESLELLKTHPQMGAHFEKPIRKWLVAGRYGLIYSVEPRGIIVLACVDMRRDLRPLHRRLRQWLGNE